MSQNYFKINFLIFFKYLTMKLSIISILFCFFCFTDLTAQEGSLDYYESSENTFIPYCVDIDVTGVSEHYVGNEEVEYEFTNDTLHLNYECSGIVELTRVNASPGNRLVERWLYIKSKMVFICSNGNYWYIEQMQSSTLMRRKDSLEYYHLSDL